MRLRLVVCACVVSLLVARDLAAEDRVTVRGNYYRETSTRVLAPVVYVEKDLPDERFTIGAEYLLDAVTSASIGAGAAAVTGGDYLFTEFRHEGTLRASARLKEWSFGGFFRYSTESDWVSRSFGVGGARDVFGRAGTVSLQYTANLDSVLQLYGGRAIPWYGGKMNIEEMSSETGKQSNLLQVHYLGLGYTHALTRRLLGGALLEGIFARGPQDNPYRKVRDGLDESHPRERKRIALSGFLRYAIPKTPLVLEGRYRFYADDWGILANAPEVRAHVRFLRRVVLRLRYRFYQQTGAWFWREDGNYGSDTIYRTADPKMTRFHSHTPGAELTVELDGLAKVRGLHWLRGAWVQATYNHVFYSEGYRFGPYARLGSLAFSVPF
ncbi:DUF3570 domain-containing protein [Nannocystis pusilla]|uniref:DUF3570 domain-containing protein n=1 Tax=Nannocystis pusilla TaxID=889268 RepID=UPI001CCA01BF|nr:DUF3570 domain-containing protein [Nannocystis pusilla]